MEIPQSVHIAGRMNDLSDLNQVKLSIYNAVFVTQNLSNPALRESVTEHTETIMNKRFAFNLGDLNSIKYAVLSYHDYPSSDFYIDFKFIIEPGDSVAITKTGNGLIFTGRNSEKYNCQYQLERLKRKLQGPDTEKDSMCIYNYFNKSDSLAERSFQLLDTYKGKIPAYIYSHEKAAIIAYFESSKSGFLLDNKVHQLSENALLNDGRSRIKYIKNYKNPVWNKEIKKELLLDKFISNSTLFLGFIYDQYRYDSCVKTNLVFSIPKYYEYISREFDGYTKEWLIFQLLSDATLRRSDANGIYTAISHALKSNVIKNHSIKEYLSNQLVNSPGTQSFNFTLSDAYGKKVRQSDFLGRTILLDFWYIGCGACIETKPYLDSISDLFKKEEFQIISICTEERSERDYSGEWKKALSTGKYTSEENVNLYAPSHERSTPEIVEKYNIRAYPTIILIDRDGKLTEQPVNPRIDKGESLIRLIRNSLDK